MPVQFSAGRERYDNTPEQRVADDFSEFVEHVDTHRGAAKHQDYVCGPMAFGHHYNTSKHPEGAHYRLASHAEPCSFLPLDIDYMKSAAVQRSVLEWCRNTCSYAYETASSTPKSPRMRVLIALDREVSRDERTALGRAVQAEIEAEIEAVFGSGAIEFDGSVYRPEQPTYNPLKGAKSWKFFDAPPLEVDDVLARAPGQDARSKGSGSDHMEALRGLEPLPRWLAEHCHGPVVNPFGGALHVLKTPFLMAQIKSALAATPSDDRDEWISVGHALTTLDADGGDVGKRLWLEWSSKSPKFDPDDADRVWESINPTSTSHEQIFRMAEAHGWDVEAENARIRGELGLPALGAVPVAGSADGKGAGGGLCVTTYGPPLLDDLATMPRRSWRVRHLLLDGYIGLILGPGGAAKSMVQLTAAISVATGRDLLGLGPVRQCNVLLINNEDDAAELRRRVAAVLIRFEIDPAELEGRLFTVSGYMQPVRFAKAVENTVSRSADLRQIEEFIAEREIGAVLVDPFISTHTASENDNNAMDQVVAIYKRLAGETNVAINIVHHTRKIGGDSEAHAGDAESGRGASAIKDAARAAVTIARMGRATADKLRIGEDERGSYIRMDVGKMNFAAHDSKANWFRVEPTPLPNGDTVGVPVPTNLDTLLAQVQDGQQKWTAESMAAAVAPLLPGTDSQVPWSDIRERFKDAYGVGKSAASEHLTLLPQAGEPPIRVDAYDIWISRTAPRNGWMVHKQGVPDA